MTIDSIGHLISDENEVSSEDLLVLRSDDPSDIFLKPASTLDGTFAEINLEVRESTILPEDAPTSVPSIETDRKLQVAGGVGTGMENSKEIKNIDANISERTRSISENIQYVPEESMLPEQLLASPTTSPPLLENPEIELVEFMNSIFCLPDSSSSVDSLRLYQTVEYKMKVTHFLLDKFLDTEPLRKRFPFNGDQEQVSFHAAQDLPEFNKKIIFTFKCIKTMSTFAESLHLYLSSQSRDELVEAAVLIYNPTPGDAGRYVESLEQFSLLFPASQIIICTVNHLLDIYRHGYLESSRISAILMWDLTDCLKSHPFVQLIKEIYDPLKTALMAKLFSSSLGADFLDSQTGKMSEPQETRKKTENVAETEKKDAFTSEFTNLITELPRLVGFIEPLTDFSILTECTSTNSAITIEQQRQLAKLRSYQEAYICRIVTFDLLFDQMVLESDRATYSRFEDTGFPPISVKLFETSVSSSISEVPFENNELMKEFLYDLQAFISVKSARSLGDLVYDPDYLAIQSRYQCFFAKKEKKLRHIYNTFGSFMASLYYQEKLCYEDKFFEARNTIQTFKNSKSAVGPLLHSIIPNFQPKVLRFSSSLSTRLQMFASTYYQRDTSSNGQMIEIVLVNDTTACQLLSTYLASRENFEKCREIIHSESPLRKIILPSEIGLAEEQIICLRREHDFQSLIDHSKLGSIFKLKSSSTDVTISKSNPANGTNLLALARASRQMGLGKDKNNNSQMVDPRITSSYNQIVPIQKKLKTPSIQSHLLRSHSSAPPRDGPPDNGPEVASLVKRITVVMTFEMYNFWRVFSNLHLESSSYSYRLWLIDGAPSFYSHFEALVKSEKLPIEFNIFLNVASKECATMYSYIQQWQNLLMVEQSALQSANDYSNSKRNFMLEWLYRHLYAPIMRTLSQESYFASFPTIRLSSCPRGVNANGDQGILGAILSLNTAPEMLHKFCSFLPKRIDSSTALRQDYYWKDQNLTLALLGSFKRAANHARCLPVYSFIKKSLGSSAVSSGAIDSTDANSDGWFQCRLQLPTTLPPGFESLSSIELGAHPTAIAPSKVLAKAQVCYLAMKKLYELNLVDSNALPSELVRNYRAEVQEELEEQENATTGGSTTTRTVNGKKVWSFYPYSTANESARNTNAIFYLPRNLTYSHEKEQKSDLVVFSFSSCGTGKLYSMALAVPFTEQLELLFNGDSFLTDTLMPNSFPPFEVYFSHGRWSNESTTVSCKLSRFTLPDTLTLRKIQSFQTLVIKCLSSRNSFLFKDNEDQNDLFSQLERYLSTPFKSRNTDNRPECDYSDELLYYVLPLLEDGSLDMPLLDSAFQLLTSVPDSYPITEHLDHSEHLLYYPLSDVLYQVDKLYRSIGPHQGIFKSRSNINTCARSKACLANISAWTFEEYYKVKYGIQLNPNQPLISVSPLQNFQNYLKPLSCDPVEISERLHDLKKLKYLDSSSIKETITGSISTFSMVDLLKKNKGNYCALVVNQFGILPNSEFSDVLLNLETHGKIPIRLSIQNEIDIDSKKDTSYGDKISNISPNTPTCSRAVTFLHEIIMIPELCHIWPIHKNSYNDILLVPVFLHQLIQFLKAFEFLQEKLASNLSTIDLPPLIPFLLPNLIAALTAPNSEYPTRSNYERLEILGDSLLKIHVSIDVFLTRPLDTEGKLTSHRSRIVSNRNLFKLATDHLNLRNIGDFCGFLAPQMFCPPFVPAALQNDSLVNLFPVKNLIDPQLFWFHLNSLHESILTRKAMTTALPRGTTNTLDPIDPLRQGDPFEKEQRQFHVIYGSKALADMVEAILGCAFYSLIAVNPKNPSCIFNPEVMGFLRVLLNKWQLLSDETFHLLQLDTMMNFSGLHLLELPMMLPSPFLQISLVIKRIFNGYQFKKPELLYQAIKHSSVNNIAPAVDSANSTYERLEFLGDAVLDWHVTYFLYTHYNNLSPLLITESRSAAVNNESFSRIFIILLLRVAVAEMESNERSEIWTLNAQIDWILSVFHCADSIKLENIKPYIEWLLREPEFLADLSLLNADRHSLPEKGLLVQNMTEPQPSIYMSAPKIIGDLFESIFGAFFLDFYCEKSLKKETDDLNLNTRSSIPSLDFWEDYLAPLMVPYLKRHANPYSAELNPIKNLIEFLQRIAVPRHAISFLVTDLHFMEKPQSSFESNASSMPVPPGLMMKSYECQVKVNDICLSKVVASLPPKARRMAAKEAFAKLTDPQNTSLVAAIKASVI